MNAIYCGFLTLILPYVDTVKKNGEKMRRGSRGWSELPWTFYLSRSPSSPPGYRGDQTSIGRGGYKPFCKPHPALFPPRNEQGEGTKGSINVSHCPVLLDMTLQAKSACRIRVAQEFCNATSVINVMTDGALDLTGEK